MTDFSNEIVAIEKAIASGARSVSYGDKSISYDSLEDMLKRLSWLKSQQALNTGAKRRPNVALASFSRGGR